MQQQMSFLDGPFGKTCREPSAVTAETTSEQSSKPSAKSAKVGGCQYLNRKNGIMPGAYWETVTALHGDCTTLNFGESPSVERESTLLQILEENAPEKYYLSRKACEGILRRAQRRGKILPEMLREALEEVVRYSASRETESTERTRPGVTGADGTGGGIAYTLNTIDRQAVVCFAWANSGRAGLSADETAPTVKSARNGEPGVAYSIDCRNLVLNEGKSGTLQAKNQGGYSLNYQNPVLCLNDQGGGCEWT